MVITPEYTPARLLVSVKDTDTGLFLGPTRNSGQTHAQKPHRHKNHHPKMSMGCTWCGRGKPVTRGEQNKQDRGAGGTPGVDVPLSQLPSPSTMKYPSTLTWITFGG
jgi:hypothetical protein